MQQHDPYGIRMRISNSLRLSDVQVPKHSIVRFKWARIGLKTCELSSQFLHQWTLVPFPLDGNHVASCVPFDLSS